MDGQRYLDLCLGDTGAMTGHAPAATLEAINRQAARGLTFMLPTEAGVWVGEELARERGQQSLPITRRAERREFRLQPEQPPPHPVLQ